MVTLDVSRPRTSMRLGFVALWFGEGRTPKEKGAGRREGLTFSQVPKQDQGFYQHLTLLLTFEKGAFSNRSQHEPDGNRLGPGRPESTLYPPAPFSPLSVTATFRPKLWFSTFLKAEFLFFTYFQKNHNLQKNKSKKST